MKTELWTQLKVVVPIAALLFLLLLIGTGHAWTYCIDIGGGTYCWDFPDE